MANVQGCDIIVSEFEHQLRAILTNTLEESINFKATD